MPFLCRFVQVTVSKFYTAHFIIYPLDLLCNSIGTFTHAVRNVYSITHQKNPTCQKNQKQNQNQNRLFPSTVTIHISCLFLPCKTKKLCDILIILKITIISLL